VLQRLAAQGGEVPGRTLVVAGTEHVSFSVIATARHCGLRVAAMVEAGSRVMSFRAARWVASGLFGIPVHLRTSIAEVVGRDKVERVVLDGPGGRRELPCDGVVFTGEFRPDAQLLPGSGIETDPRTGGPAIDQMMRTGLAGVFAAGNLLRPVESSGVAALEGARAGASAAAYVQGRMAWPAATTAIGLDDAFAYVVPQRWDGGAGEPSDAPGLRPSLRVRADQPPARVVLYDDGRVLWSGRRGTHLRGRRVAVDLARLGKCQGAVSIALEP
jgi:hypothetical protein